MLLNYHIGRYVLDSLCVGDSVWLGWSGIRIAGWSTASACNTDTNVVIQQHSHKLLMMDILMSETCWAHKKWNKITSDIKLVFYSSTITSLSLLSDKGSNNFWKWKIWGPILVWGSHLAVDSPCQSHTYNCCIMDVPPQKQMSLPLPTQTEALTNNMTLNWGNSHNKRSN